jgi:hypothetical protein
MEPGEQKQVSEVPLQANTPAPRRGGNLLFLAILLGLVACASVGALLWVNAQRVDVDENYQAKWPHDVPPYRNHRSSADYDKARKHMQVLADALMKYHEGPMGGGIRWPAGVEDLRATGMLDEDYDSTGLLSGRPIIYQPEMPIGQDPERWVMCQDVEIGWIRAQNGYRVKGPRGAVVILGDGSVKVLKQGELQNYAGLNLLHSAE